MAFFILLIFLILISSPCDLTIDSTDDTVAISCLPFFLPTSVSTFDGSRKYLPQPRARPPECLLRHPLRALDTSIILIVQARRRLLYNTPGHVKDLSGAQNDERVRLLPNNAQQQPQILQVVRVHKNTACKISVACEAYLQQAALVSVATRDTDTKQCF